MHCMPAAMMKYPLEHKKSREIDLTQVETFFNKIVTFGGSAHRLSQAVLIRFHLTGRQPYCRAYCAAMMKSPLKHNRPISPTRDPGPPLPPTRRKKLYLLP